MAIDLQSPESFQLGAHRLSGRLIVGTGKYANYQLMADCLAESGADQPLGAPRHIAGIGDVQA